MKNNKYDTLETILEKILKNDADIEAILAAHPEYADELHPLIESALNAKAIAHLKIPDEVTLRGRTKLLGHAAKLRDTAPKTRASLFTLRLASLALGLMLIFFLSGAGIINASASSLPGDSLYTVKRGWENATIWLADEEKASSLQMRYEEERREEVQELLGKKRLADVRFEGAVISLNGNKWNVAGAPITLSADTKIDSDIAVGEEVTVIGQTQADGTVLATTITLNAPLASPIITETPSISEKESINEKPDEGPKELHKNKEAGPGQKTEERNEQEESGGEEEEKEESGSEEEESGGEEDDEAESTESEEDDISDDD